MYADPLSEALALHRAIWVYVYIGITLSGYILPRDDLFRKLGYSINLNHESYGKQRNPRRGADSH